MKFAAAGFQHETNRLSPIPTTYEDFVKEDGWPGLTEGAAVFDVFTGANIPLGGFLEFVSGRCEAVPVLWTSAEPASLVRDDAFELICKKILDGIEAAMPCDGIYLDLHGAMVTESYEDGEGEFLTRLRERFGREIPVSVSLDLHANITPEMVEMSDVMTIFRTYPHLDMAETGYRAGELLYEIIESGKKPFSSFRKPPLLIPLHAQCTDLEPARSLYRNLPEANSLQTGTADIALGFPASDIAQNGPAIVAYDFSESQSNNRADLLEEAFMAEESSFPTPLYSPQDAIQMAMNRSGRDKPVILAEVQDTSGAGSTSDTTYFLAELVRAGVRNTTFAAMFDKEAAETAHQAGIGGEFNCVLGGKYGGPDLPGFEGRFKVAALSNGVFEFSGEMMSGITANIGPTAALDLIGCDAEIRIVVTSERIQPVDQALFTHLGIQPAEMDIVCLKSTVHFRADFDPIADEIILVEGTGFSPCILKYEYFPRLRPGVRLL